MPTMCDELVSSIFLSDPTLSPQEVSQQIATLIERDILPTVLSRLRLPRLPSPLSLKRKELIQIRYGKRRDTDFQENVGFVQDLEKLRLEYDGSDATNEDYYIGGLIGNTQMPFHQVVRHFKKEEESVPEPDIIQQKLGISSLLETPEITMRKPSRLVTFDSNIAEKITSDPNFEMIIADVESKIRTDYGHETLNVYFSFSIRKDMVDPHREKTIIRINLPDCSFDEKMKYWEKIDADIRNVIKALGVTEPERKAINRNLFIHVEPT